MAISPGVPERHLVAVVVEQRQLGVGHRQADGAAVGGGVHRVAGGRRAGLGQAVALEDRAAGLLQPQPRGAAAAPPCRRRREIIRWLQSTLSKSGWLAIALNSVFTAGKLWKRWPASSFSTRRDVARVGDQDVAAAHAHGQHHVRVEAEDVIQRQRADGDDLLAGGIFFSAGWYQASACRMLATRLRCSSTAPLLTPVVPPVYCSTAMSSGPTAARLQRLAAALRQRVVEAHRAGQLEGRHHLLDACAPRG